MEDEKLLIACVAGGGLLGIPFYSAHGYPPIGAGCAIGVIIYLQMRNFLIGR